MISCNKPQLTAETAWWEAEAAQFQPLPAPGTVIRQGTIVFDETLFSWIKYIVAWKTGFIPFSKDMDTQLPPSNTFDLTDTLFSHIKKAKTVMANTSS